MALTKAPLFGLDASGTLAGSIVFSKWKGRTYVRRHAVPHNPKSGLQVGMRASFKFTSQNYAALSAGDVAAWKAVADPYSITPLDAQQRYSQRNIRLGRGCIHNPTDAVTTTPTAPATASATALPLSLQLTWTHPSVTPGDYTAMIYMSTTTGFTPSPATLIAVLPQADLSYLVRGLTAGTPYYFRICETNKAGTVGALIAQFTGTPTA